MASHCTSRDSLSESGPGAPEYFEFKNFACLPGATRRAAILSAAKASNSVHRRSM
jgi:hypothetical protein